MFNYYSYDFLLKPSGTAIYISKKNKRTKVKPKTFKKKKATKKERL